MLSTICTPVGGTKYPLRHDKLRAILTHPQMPNSVNIEFVRFCARLGLGTIDKQSHPHTYRLALTMVQLAEEPVEQLKSKTIRTLGYRTYVSAQKEVAEDEYIHEIVDLIENSVLFLYSSTNGELSFYSWYRYMDQLSSEAIWNIPNHPDVSVDVILDKLVQLLAEHFKIDLEIGKLLYG